LEPAADRRAGVEIVADLVIFESVGRRLENVEGVRFGSAEVRRQRRGIEIGRQRSARVLLGQDHVLEIRQGSGAARIADGKRRAGIGCSPGSVEGLKSRRSPGEAGIVAEQVSAASNIWSRAKDRMIQRIESIHAKLDAALLAEAEVFLHG